MTLYPNGNHKEPNPNYVPPASVKRNALIRISESDDWIVDYDRERGQYRVSYFEDNHFKDEHWFDAYEDKEVSSVVREEIANAVEEKMTYMCGCLNCITKVTQIIKDDVKPFDMQCDNCEIECRVKGN